MKKNTFPFDKGGEKRLQNEEWHFHFISFTLRNANTSVCRDNAYKRFSALPVLQKSIKEKDLTESLEIIATLGFEGDAAVFALSTAQMLLGGAE